MSYCKMKDLNLTKKRLLIREDLNVPMKDGEITSDVRIKAVIPTLQMALKANAAVIIVSHLGRPTEGVYEEEFSLAPVAQRLSELLGQPVPLIKNWINGVDVKYGQVVLCENVRFNVGEKANDPELSKKMALLCDIYINDAFATAHRAESSTCGIAEYANKSCAGLLMSTELDALEKVMANPKRPLVAVVGGSKVSTKLALLKSIAKKVDYLIIGGGIANTFLAASGYPIGKSLFEPDFIDEAEHLLGTAETMGVKIPLPTDVIVSTSFSNSAEAEEQSVSQVADDERILDIGSDTAQQYAEIISKAKTVLWNGPVGAFEIEQFSQGTKTIARAIANSSAYSVAGGGDTIAAIEKYGIANKISYISTGGGAFLAYLEGEVLPAVKALEKAYEKSIEK